MQKTSPNPEITHCQDCRQMAEVGHTRISPILAAPRLPMCGRMCGHTHAAPFSFKRIPSYFLMIHAAGKDYSIRFLVGTLVGGQRLFCWRNPSGLLL
jgi:hypothetical protein